MDPIFPSTTFFGIFSASFVLGFLAVVSPGPVSTAIVSQAPRHGWKVGALVATGHSFMEFIIVALIAVGLSTGLAHPSILTTIAIIGGLLLVWMGADMLNGLRQGMIRIPGVDPNAESMTQAQLVRLGVITTLSNPFWYAWWVTVAVVPILEAQNLGLLAVLAFYLGHISADYLWDTFLSTVISSGKRWISDRIYQGIIALCGGFFVYLGVMFIGRGLAG